jgi:hypothetical protein
MSHKYTLGPVKPWVSAAAYEIGDQFDVKSVGGWRAVGSVPNSDHPKGLALDFMVGLTDAGKAKGDAIAQYAIANADRLGITYVIWYRRIYEISEGNWKEYHGPVPHTDHVHVSFSSSGGDPNAPVSTEPVGFPNPFDPTKWPIIKQLNDIANKIEDPERWKRLGYYALGAALVIAGLIWVFASSNSDKIAETAQIVEKVK